MIKHMLTTTGELQLILNLISYMVYKYLQNGPHTVFDAEESFPEF